jgi:hypothetical protein
VGSCVIVARQAYASCAAHLSFNLFRLVFLNTTCYGVNRLETVPQEYLAKFGSERSNQHLCWLLVEQAAVHISTSPDSICKWIERKLPPAHKIGWL